MRILSIIAIILVWVHILPIVWILGLVTMDHLEWAFEPQYIKWRCFTVAAGLTLVAILLLTLASIFTLYMLR